MSATLRLVGSEVLLPEGPVVAVVGTGAVGGYYGGRLAQGGEDVRFLLRSDYAAVKERGLEVRSCDGDFHLSADRVKVYRDVREMGRGRGVDLVIVALKTTSEGLYGELIGPLVGEGTVILSIQNGLGTDERLAELFGAERVIGGLAFVCINRIGPGVIHHMSHGQVKIGEFGAGRSVRTEQIARMFVRCGVKCEVLESLKKGRWEKLIWNIPFNGLGAVMDLTTDRLIASVEGRKLIGDLMGEVMAAGRADGVTFGISTEDMISRQIRSTEGMGAYRSSMQIDRQEGRALEVEAILGEPLRRGREKGVEMPRLAALCEMARVVDGARGRTEITKITE
ncbi:MAG TPA: 2-dehydropantoate 2-reductase [Phycisphaerae bacterium]|nr:2-dehydropantoate 2-reductase [Phycisphaerae bacterium]